MSYSFFGRHTIHALGGEDTPYMTRVWFGRLRLHVFYRGDEDPDHHNHPWPFVTFPLTPYVEEVIDHDFASLVRSGGFVPSIPVDSILAVRQVVPAFRFSFRKAGHTHRVIGRYSGIYVVDDAGFAVPQTDGRKIVTLVWRGRIAGRWGFLKNRDGRWCWQHWKEYVAYGGKQAACAPASDTESVSDIVSQSGRP